jgi:hypothetical protein
MRAQRDRYVAKPPAESALKRTYDAGWFCSCTK